MSKREALVVEVKMEEIPGAENIALVRIDDYTCAVRKVDWVGKTKAAYCAPDTLVPTNNDIFGFLAPDAKYNIDSYPDPAGVYARIRAKKFMKGTVCSYGVLVPVDDNIPIGTNLYEELKLSHYEPQISGKGSGPDGGVFKLGEACEAPKLPFTPPIYDMEDAQKYAHKVFSPDSLVWISLKVHGMSWRAVYWEGQMHVSSHYVWKKEYPTKPIIDEKRVMEKYGEIDGPKRMLELEEKLSNWKPSKSIFWEALQQNNDIEKFCINNPGIIVYGEIANTQGEKFRYRCKPGEYKIFVFDLMKDGKFMDCGEARELGKDMVWTHSFYENIPFNWEQIIKLNENLPTVANDKIEEGICVRASCETFNPHTIRSILKLRTPQYLEKS